MISLWLILGILLHCSLATSALEQRDDDYFTAPEERDDDFLKVPNNTVSNKHLRTWWHGSGEVNKWTVVEKGNVRQSHLYSVQVASGVGPLAKYYDSFVYETLPRNGHENLRDPRDQGSITFDDDGISIERDIGMTMAWSQFLYSSDVNLRITRLDGKDFNQSSVVIVPDDMEYRVSKLDRALHVRIPYRPNGIKISVEFQDDQFDFHNSCDGTSCTLIQDVNEQGAHFTSKYTKQNPIIASEPLNSLMIFASPFQTPDMIPNPRAKDTLLVRPGHVKGLNTTKASTVYFPPGVSWFDGTAHANLSSTVKWVHFEAGSYVKGAIQFNTRAKEMKATGHGVLSGEQYVYQANPTKGYRNSKSNDDCLRMWRGHSFPGIQQTFILNGPTINAPPFNSMDFSGDLDSISVRAWDYKQMGAFFAQTDGLQAYPGSHMHDIFYHSNDDTIKTYYSNVHISRVAVWKAHTAPVIQFGWASRNMTNVTVSDVDVLHARWNTNGSHPSLIGANQLYQAPESASDTAAPANVIRDVTYANIRAPTVAGNLFRIVPLASIFNLSIANVSLRAFPFSTSGIGASQLVSMTGKDKKPVEVEGFVVEGFRVDGKEVSYARKNWDTGSLGDLGIAADLKAGVDVVDGGGSG